MDKNQRELIKNFVRLYRLTCNVAGHLMNFFPKSADPVYFSNISNLFTTLVNIFIQPVRSYVCVCVIRTYFQHFDLVTMDHCGKKEV